MIIAACLALHKQFGRLSPLSRRLSNNTPIHEFADQRPFRKQSGNKPIEPQLRKELTKQRNEFTLPEFLVRDFVQRINGLMKIAFQPFVNTDREKDSRLNEGLFVFDRYHFSLPALAIRRGRSQLDELLVRVARSAAGGSA